VTGQAWQGMYCTGYLDQQGGLIAAGWPQALAFLSG
jgi:hypothetical protein